MSMMTVEPLAVPLWEDPPGVFRVGQCRVLLEMVIHAYWRGETPEGIVDSFEMLNLADVYAVLAYYLRHRSEVDAYMARREAEANALQELIEASQPSRADLRERLLQRAKAREDECAASAR